MVEVYLLNIARVKFLNHMKHLVSAEKQRRLEKMQHLLSAQQTLAADLLARAIICSKFGWKNDAIEFSYNEYGKPALKNKNDFHFNLSHCGNWVVMAVSSDEIGIDIEQVTEMDLTIGESFFSPLEMQQVRNKPVFLQADFFFQIWTLKESYLKMSGYGLSADLDSFTIQIKEDSSPLLIKSPPETVFFRQYELPELANQANDNYKIAVCSRNGKFSPSLIEVNDNFMIFPRFFAVNKG